MNIAVIGAGNVGGALGGRWAKAGHQVTFGLRKPDDKKLQELASKLGARLAPIADAARVADTIVFATPWAATKAAITACGELRGKTVIDCTNPLLADLSGLELGHTISAGERVAEWAKGASVFKAFNTTGADNMASQAGYQIAPVMFVAGDDAARKPAVLRLASDAGFDAVDAGPLRQARLLEPLAMLWISLAYQGGLGRDFAFALMRRVR